MQRNREVRDNSNTYSSPFDSSGSFGFSGSIFPSLFGAKDPFDDPFFTRPHGSLFGSQMFRSTSLGNLQHVSRTKEPVIEELDSDAEGSPEEMEEDDGTDGARKNRAPIVEHPEDQTHDHGNNMGNRRDISYSTNHGKVDVIQPQTRSVSYQRVTYGGINGAYYSATTSRRTGSDGVTLEESKHADSRTSQATHRISRGIHNKGHSVMRKLDSDGKVDTMQTLHNLEENELEGFEQAWKGSNDRRLHGWNDTFGFPSIAGASTMGHGQLAIREKFLDPFRDHSVRNEGQSPQAQVSRGKAKKIVTINIE